MRHPETIKASELYRFTLKSENIIKKKLNKTQLTVQDLANFDEDQILQFKQYARYLRYAVEQAKRLVHNYFNYIEQRYYEENEMNSTDAQNEEHEISDENSIEESESEPNMELQESRSKDENNSEMEHGDGDENGKVEICKQETIDLGSQKMEHEMNDKKESQSNENVTVEELQIGFVESKTVISYQSKEPQRKVLFLDNFETVKVNAKNIYKTPEESCSPRDLRIRFIEYQKQEKKELKTKVDHCFRNQISQSTPTTRLVEESCQERITKENEAEKKGNDAEKEEESEYSEQENYVDCTTDGDYSDGEDTEERSEEKHRDTKESQEAFNSDNYDDSDGSEEEYEKYSCVAYNIGNSKFSKKWKHAPHKKIIKKLSSNDIILFTEVATVEQQLKFEEMFEEHEWYHDKFHSKDKISVGWKEPFVLLDEEIILSEVGKYMVMPFDSPSGRITMIFVHLKYKVNIERRYELLLKFLSELQEDEQIIIMGDFNVKPDQLKEAFEREIQKFEFSMAITTFYVQNSLK